VRTMRCGEVEIRTRRPRTVNTDGELATETPAKFKIVPQAISVFVPCNRPAQDERDQRKAGREVPPTSCCFQEGCSA
jgi:hypothetical protein